jgi:hypothetical protein
MQDAMMLNSRCNDVVALFLRGIRHAFDRQIVAFRAAPGKGDFGWTTAKNIGNLLA